MTTPSLISNALESARSVVLGALDALEGLASVLETHFATDSAGAAVASVPPASGGSVAGGEGPGSTLEGEPEGGSSPDPAAADDESGHSPDVEGGGAAAAAAAADADDSSPAGDTAQLATGDAGPAAEAVAPTSEPGSVEVPDTSTVDPRNDEPGAAAPLPDGSTPNAGVTGESLEPDSSTS